MNAVAFQPLKHMAPASVEGGFDGGVNDKRNISALHQVKQHIDIIGIRPCAVRAGLQTFSAEDALFHVALYLAVFRLVC